MVMPAADLAEDATLARRVIARLQHLARAPDDIQALSDLQSLSTPQRRSLHDLATAALHSGQTDTALSLLCALVVAEPRDARARAGAARVLLHKHQGDAAVQMIEEGLALGLDDAVLHSAHGAVLYRLNQFSAAREALARGLRDAETLKLLGRANDILGDHEAAVQAYTEALKVPGPKGEVWYNLAQHLDFSTDDTAFDQLTQATSGPAEDPGLLDLARSKALADRGEHGESFERLAQANARVAASVPAGALAGRRQRIATALQRADLLPPTSAPTPGPRPILIVGMPRSGTSLLEQLLARHPDVAAGGELAALSQAVKPLLEHPEPGARDTAQVATRYRAALNEVSPEARAITDKMPGNVYFAGYALAALPEARVIWLRRSPMAVAWSCFRTRFAQGHQWSYSFETIADEIRQTRQAMEHWAARFPDRILALRYEDLTEAPEQHLERVLAFCDLPRRDPDKAEPPDAAVHTASVLQARKGVYRGSSEAWRVHETRLRPLAALLTDEIAAHELRGMT